MQLTKLIPILLSCRHYYTFLRSDKVKHFIAKMDKDLTGEHRNLNIADMTCIL